MLEPYAPALLVETTGQIPRGDLLPEANPVSLRVRAVATALGLEPMRVYVDPPGGREVNLCADAKLASRRWRRWPRPARRGGSRSKSRGCRRGRRRARPSAHSRDSGGAGVLQAVGTDGGSEDIKELGGACRSRCRARCARRSSASSPSRSAICRAPPPSGTSRSSAGPIDSPSCCRATRWPRWRRRRAAKIRARRRASLDLVRYLASEGCWRAYVRLTHDSRGLR